MVNDFAELGTAPGGPPTIVERPPTVEAAEGERDPRGDDHKEATGHGGHINRRGTASRDALAPVAAPSPTETRTPPPTIALSSSAPSHVGRCSSHQHTVRISWTGSRSGSQRGQYDDASWGVS